MWSKGIALASCEPWDFNYFLYFSTFHTYNRAHHTIGTQETGVEERRYPGVKDIVNVRRMCRHKIAETYVGRGGVSIQGAVWECPGPHSSQTLLNLGNLGIRTECTGSVSYKRSRRVFRKTSSELFPCRKTFPIQSGRYPKASWQDRIWLMGKGSWPVPNQRLMTSSHLPWGQTRTQQSQALARLKSKTIKEKKPSGENMENLKGTQDKV